MFELKYNINDFLVFPIDSRKISMADECLKKSIKGYLLFYFKRILENASSTSSIVCAERGLTGFFNEQLKTVQENNADELVKFTFATYVVLSLFELCVAQNKINATSLHGLASTLCGIHDFLCHEIKLDNFNELLKKIATDIQIDVSSLQKYIGSFSEENSNLLLKKHTVSCNPDTRHGNKYFPYEPLINNINDLMGCLAIQQHQAKLNAILAEKSAARCCLLPLIRRSTVSKLNFIEYKPNEQTPINSGAPGPGVIN